MHNKTDAFQGGLTYESFIEQWDQHIQTPQKELDRSQRKYRFYAQYNKERSEVVASQYQPSQEIRDVLQQVKGDLSWNVITEDWCVDSAFSLPVIKALTDLSSQNILRIFPRDSHPELMDAYLTRGARSIPKLIVADEMGTVRFTWGPRPQSLQNLRVRWADEGLDPARISQLQLDWYQDAGWLIIEQELNRELETLASDGVPVTAFR